MLHEQSVDQVWWCYVIWYRRNYKNV